MRAGAVPRATSPFPGPARGILKRVALSEQPGVVRALSIDGGGIRGVIPARFLGELERVAGRPVSQLFDVIAGTSTGGIIALGLATPGLDGRPKWSAAEAAAIYATRGREIFPRFSLAELRARRDRRAARPILQLIGAVTLPRRYGNARYYAEGLETVLHDTFEDIRLSEALVDVIVTSYDWKAGRAVVFNSREAREGGHDPLMRDVARATTAAPTYFPPLRLLLDSGDELVLIDGGLAANNPVGLAYYEMLIREQRERRDLDIRIVSLGTGRPPKPIPTYRQLWSRGWLALGMGMLGVVFDGTSEIQDEVLRKVIAKKEPGSRYWRFDTDLWGCSLAMDDARASNVAALSRLADGMIADRRDVVEEVARLLGGTS